MIGLLEVCALSLVWWPLFRAGIHPALRRAYPKTAAAMILFVVTAVSAAVVLWLWLPGLLHIVAALACGAALYAVWHARPDFGRVRGLPPGSLSMLPFGYITDPSFFQKQIERYGYVFKVSQFGKASGPDPFSGLQPVCCIDLKRGIQILHEYDERLIPPSIPSSRFIPKKYLREMNHDDHRHYRRVFSSAFKTEILDECAEFMRRHVRASLLNMADQSSSNDDGALEPSNSLLTMTFGIFIRCFYGITPEDSRSGDLRKLVRAIDLSNRNDREMNLALEEFASIIRDEAQRTIAAGSNPHRSFLTEIVSIEPNGLDDLTTMRNFIFILGASWIDATGLIEWLLKELCDHPNWLKKMSKAIEPAEAVETDPLSLCCVKETLRLHQSEYLYRRVLEEIPVGDYIIPKGWLLRVCVRESHRDPRVFEHPDEFKPDRFFNHRYSRSDYSTFGASRISCLGEHLSLMLGQIFVEELASNVKIATVQDGPLEFRRWHWKPSSKWRVRISRREVETLSDRAGTLPRT